MCATSLRNTLTVTRLLFIVEHVLSFSTLLVIIDRSRLSCFSLCAGVRVHERCWFVTVGPSATKRLMIEVTGMSHIFAGCYGFDAEENMKYLLLFRPQSELCRTLSFSIPLFSC